MIVSGEHHSQDDVIQLSIWKHFCTAQVTEHWHRMPREVVGSLLWNVAWAWYWAACPICGCASAGWLDHITSRGPLQPKPFCDSVFLKMCHLHSSIPPCSCSSLLGCSRSGLCLKIVNPGANLIKEGGLQSSSSIVSGSLLM